MKKAVKKNQEAIALAVAGVLASESEPVTKKRPIREVLEKVKAFLNLDTLTLSSLKKGIANWLNEGWAVVSEGFIQVTRAGRAMINELADRATAPQAVVAT